MSEAATSDFQARPNVMTREDFLRRVLYSGQVTKISQHLALVIFLLAEGKNQIKTSVRDLERITGWTRTAIRDHLSELEVFMNITFGSGRAKTLFELQGVIEDAIATAVVSGSLATTPDAKLAASQPDAIVASEAAATADANACGQPDGRKPDHVVASQPDATPKSDKESFPPYPPSKKPLSLSGLESEVGDVREADATEVRVNGVAIYGPGFTLDYGAIDLAAGTIGMSKDRARAIAEVCARDWAANGKKPDHPMNFIRATLRTELNRDLIDDVKLAKARGPSQPTKTFRR